MKRLLPIYVLLLLVCVSISFTVKAQAKKDTTKVKDTYNYFVTIPAEDYMKMSGAINDWLPFC